MAALCSKARSASPPEQAIFSFDDNQTSSRLGEAETMNAAKMAARFGFVALAGLVLVACQSKSYNSAPSGGSKSASLRAMEQVAIAAHKCWIASKDPAFKSYQMANELNNFGGTPRFLLVPGKHYGGKPLLVVQARGNSNRVEVFGPLMAEPLGGRIGSDIARWQTGNGDCGAKA
jgi:hypothetical protein